ncbi:hypothetical protein ACLEVW_16725, partial [Escherichia coli]
NTDDLFVGKTLLHGDVLMWLMKTLLTSGCTNQRGAGQAMQTLMGSGVLARCRIHNDVILDSGNDASSAYKLGTYLYQKDNSCNLFNTLTEARDAIKDAYESYCGIDDCPQCSKYIDD